MASHMMALADNLTRAIIAALLCSFLAACGSVHTALPDLAKKTTPHMTSKQKAAAIEEMLQKSVAHEREAVEQIQSSGRDI